MFLLTAPLRASPAALHAADAPRPAGKATQELPNSIHVKPKRDGDCFTACA